MKRASESAGRKSDSSLDELSALDAAGALAETDRQPYQARLVRAGPAAQAAAAVLHDVMAAYVTTAVPMASPRADLRQRLIARVARRG